MLRMKTIFFGVVFLFTSSFVNYSLDQKIINLHTEQLLEIPTSINISTGINGKDSLVVPDNYDYSDEDFEYQVLVDTAGILGWQDYKIQRYGGVMYTFVNRNSLAEDTTTEEKLYVNLIIEPAEDGEQSNGQTFHGGQ